MSCCGRRIITSQYLCRNEVKQKNINLLLFVFFLLHHASCFCRHILWLPHHISACVCVCAELLNTWYSLLNRVILSEWIFVEHIGALKHNCDINNSPRPILVEVRKIPSLSRSVSGDGKFMQRHALDTHFSIICWRNEEYTHYKFYRIVCVSSKLLRK
jgi:hypothetical protein